MIWRLSRLRCRIFGHRWSNTFLDTNGEPRGMQVCDRLACRGDVDAYRWLG